MDPLQYVHGSFMLGSPELSCHLVVSSMYKVNILMQINWSVILEILNTEKKD